MEKATGRGQVGLEYVAIVGLVLVIAIPAAYYAYITANAQATQAQADITVGKIADAADFVFSSGPGARATVNIAFPSGIASAQAGGREILFSMRSPDGHTTDVYRVIQANFSPVNLTSLEGTRVFVIAYDSSGNLTLSPVENSTTALPADTIPPIVYLLSPADGNDSRNHLVNFSYLPSDNINLANATLYSNFSGTWSANSSNQSALAVGIASFINLTNVPEGYFVWNVLVCDNSTLSNCAFNSSNFTLRIDVTAPGAPVLSSPANASSGNRTPVFGWTAVSDVSSPVSYWLQASNNDPAFTPPFDVDVNTTSTGFAVSASLQNNKQFYWRVRATDAVGNVGPWSQVWWYHT